MSDHILPEPPREIDARWRSLSFVARAGMIAVPAFFWLLAVLMAIPMREELSDATAYVLSGIAVALGAIAFLFFRAMDGRRRRLIRDGVEQEATLVSSVITGESDEWRELMYRYERDGVTYTGRQSLAVEAPLTGDGRATIRVLVDPRDPARSLPIPGLDP